MRLGGAASTALFLSGCALDLSGLGLGAAPLDASAPDAALADAAPPLDADLADAPAPPLDAPADAGADAAPVFDAGLDASVVPVAPTTCGGPSTLRELFDAPTGDRFLEWTSPGSTVQVTGGRLVLTPAPGLPSAASLTARYEVDLRGDVASVGVVRSGAAEVELRLGGEGGLRMALAARGAQLQAELSDGTLTRTSVAFDPVRHRFWRIREDGGSVSWETSADRRTWREVRREPTPDFARVVELSLRAANPSSSPAPGTAAFDDLDADRLLGALCPASRMSDDFEDGVRDLEWGASPRDRDACLSEETGGVTRFTMSGAGTSRCERATARAFDLRGDAVSIHLPPITSYHPPMDVYLGARTVSGRQLLLTFRDGTYRLSGPGVGTVIPYDRSSYWRIREAGGVIVYEASGDGALWYELGRLSPSFDASAVRLVFGVTTSAPMPGSVRIHVPGYNRP